MVAAPDVGWIASFVVLLSMVLCWLSVVLCFSCLSRRPVSLFISTNVFLLFFSSCSYFSLSSVTANIRVCVLACICLFSARVLIAVGISWPNHLAVFAMRFSVSFVVCDHMPRLSMRHQHGH